MTELLRHDLERGATLLEESARIMRELKIWLDGAYTLVGLGKVAALRGRPRRAATLWGAAEALREQMGMTFSHFDLAHFGYERDLDAVRSMLSEACLKAAWAEGRTMSPERAIDYALFQSTRPRERDAHPLTRRELEVLRLVARGMSNGEIAATLVLSGHTVHRHMSNVFGKLAVSSRAAAVAQAAQLGLLL
jgi:non-specific serine/threonine protein kinase